MDRLYHAEKVVGTRRVIRSMLEGKAEQVFAATDADDNIMQKLNEASEKSGVSIERLATMKALGRACGVEVPTAACAILKKQGD